MLLLAALSAAMVVRAALLPELKTNKNESVALANALRHKLMLENYDYMPPESGEPSRSVASYENQDQRAVARAGDVSGSREQYEDQKQESSNYMPEIDDRPEDNFVEIQKPLPSLSGDIEHDPNAMMRHDNPKLDRNGGDDIGKNKISFDGKVKIKRDEYNETDKRYLGKGSNKYDKLKQSKNDDKRANSQYNDPGDDNPPKRKDRHGDFKHIGQEPDKPAKLIRETENDRLDKEAEMRRDKIDNYKYDKHKDDQRLYKTDNRQTTLDNKKKRHGNQDRDLIQSEGDKRIDMRFGKSVDSRYNDLEALKAAKREQDKKNYSWFDKSDHRRPDKLIYNKKNNFERDEREKCQLNSHKNDRLHDLSLDYRENIRSDEEENNRPYKSRFQKLNNVRSDDLRQNNPDKLTREKTKREKSYKFKYDKHDDVRQEYLNENKYNQLKQDDPDNIKYGIRDEQTHGDNRHDKLTNLKEYDRDVFPQANDKSSISNLKYNKYDDLRQNNLEYDKIRHNKLIDNRDYFRHEKTDEIRHNDKKKQNLHVTNPKEKKNKHEPYGNDNKQDKSYHNQEIKKVGLKHDHIKENLLRQDYGVDDEYNRHRSKQKLDKTRNKSRGFMHSKLDTKLKEVPLKYDKLEQQLEKQFQHTNHITDIDKENNKYKNNEKRDDKYIKKRYEKYKRINNDYKYKHKFTEDDNIRRYHKGHPYRPQQLSRVVTKHPSEHYSSEHGNVQYASITNGINSVYVPRSRDIGNNNVTADDVSSDKDHFEQKEPDVSRRDLLYYVGTEKLARLMGTEDVVDVADAPTVNTRRNAKKYKILKMVTSGRRAGAGAGAGVVQEEGAGGVALVPLDGGALPSFQLPRARRQYMPSDHDSDYQAGDLLDEEIPGLNEYPEPNLARMNLSLLIPPGLTASVQDSYNQLYSPSVEGHITPDKEGPGRALFNAMNVESILNE